MPEILKEYYGEDTQITTKEYETLIRYIYHISPLSLMEDICQFLGVDS
jgi:hypothetical protein